MEIKDDQTILDEIMDRLSIMFPFECPLPYPVEHLITRWARDATSSPGFSINYSNAEPRLISCDSETVVKDDFEGKLGF
jgi:hypothetical protein